MSDRCPTCGASYALVGRVHRCVSRETKAEHIENKPETVPVKTMADVLSRVRERANA